MKLKQIHTGLLFALSALLGACAADQDILTNPTPNKEVQEEKTPIELTASYSDANSQYGNTRSVITDGSNKDMKAFQKGTSLYMLMKSEHVSDGSKNPLVTRTIMFALKEENSEGFSKTTYEPESNYFARYWDDTYARESALSILAVCTPGMGNPNAPVWGTNDTKAWKIGGSDAGYQNRPWDPVAGGGSTPYETILWPVGAYQEQSKDQSGTYNGVDFITYQDLCFSNNIGKHSETDDQRIKFDNTTKKFNPGVLKFYHALSKLTFRFKKGEGFTDDQFTFKSGTNVTLSNFYYKGTFNIQDGEFITTSPNAPVSGEISKIHQHTRTTSEIAADGFKFILDALVIPGTNLSATTDAVTFNINNNEYKLTMSQLLGAFTDVQKENIAYFDEKNTIKAGVNYVFTFTIGKSKIEKITAQVAGWETVEAGEQSPTNARIKLQLEERGEFQNSDVAFYKVNDDKTTDGVDDDYTVYNWNKIYTQMSATWSTDHWTTNLFWDSNKNFFHFRALMPASTAVLDDASKSYVNLTSAVSYSDVRWGAPMLDDGDNETIGTFKWKYGPSTNGFDGADGESTHQIYKAIGPTTNPIKLILFHMMSDLTINVTTTTGDDKVNLGDGSSSKTKVELLNYKTGGTLLLGNGLVTATSAATTTEIEQNSFTAAGVAPDTAPKAKYTYGSVPQSLEDVQLRITTPDNNEYYVVLKEITATPTFTNLDITYANDKIDRWYPGVRYTYNITLKKSGIKDIKATVVAWEEVEATYDDVTIR